MSMRGLKICLFIEQETPEKSLLQYRAGRVVEYNNRYIVGYEQYGAKETFSIGQPVYDSENNLMGYLGIAMLKHLDYTGSRNGEKIPVESWTIDNPTKDCEHGKEIYTFWQRWNGDDKNDEAAAEYEWLHYDTRE